MKKKLWLTAAVMLLAIRVVAVVCGQRQEQEQEKVQEQGQGQRQEQVQTARGRIILPIFERLNQNVDPYDNFNSWTDGEIFFRPFFFDVSDFDNEPRANGDTIYLFGGTLHEGEYGMNLLLAADGSMTIAGKDCRFPLASNQVMTLTEIERINIALIQVLEKKNMTN